MNTPPRLLDAQYRPVAIGIVAVITLAAFEGIGTATAMPVIAGDLGALGSYTWAFTGFVIASLLAMVVAGLHCDAHGPRWSLICGMGGFLVGSIIAGSAWNLALLLVGRAIQGAGSGAVIVGVYVLIARALPTELRPKAFSLLSAAWVTPALVGPLIAGWLTDNLSWRWVFWIIPPLVIAPAVLLLPRLRESDGGAPVTDRRGRIGAGVLTCFGLVLVQDGVLRLNPLGVIEAAGGLIVILASCRPLFPPGTLRLARGLGCTVAMRGILAAAFFSAELFIPLALVREAGASTTVAGMVLALAAVGWLVGSFAQGRLSEQRDRAAIARLGCSIVGCSILATSVVLLPGVPIWVTVLIWTFGAVGMGLTFPSISVQALRLSPEADQGRTSSALQIADSLLVVVVASLIGSVHALAVRAGTDGPGTYLILWSVAALIAFAGAVVAGRMTPATVS